MLAPTSSHNEDAARGRCFPPHGGLRRGCMSPIASAANTRVTSVDVARRAGVSQSTVSLVFSGKGRGRVSAATQETVRRVRARARLPAQRRRAGAAPGELARGRAAGPRRDQPVLRPRPARRPARGAGGRLHRGAGRHRQRPALGGAVLRGAARRPGRRLPALRGHAARGHGTPTSTSCSSSAGPRAARRCASTPRAAPRPPSSTCSSSAIAASAIWPRTSTPPPSTCARTARRRVLSEAGLDPDALPRAVTQITIDDARDAAGPLLDEQPTAVFCDDDIIAAGLYLAARERGLRIPRDLSVVGFDDMDFARVLDPALTTVALDAELLGATAFELLEAAHGRRARAAADRAPGRARRARLDRAAAVSDAARAVFEAHAEGYDAERRRLLPCFDAFYAAAIDALGLCERPPRRVLDLGAGTGTPRRRRGARAPGARSSPCSTAPRAMLEQARARIGDARALRRGRPRRPAARGAVGRDRLGAGHPPPRRPGQARPLRPRARRAGRRAACSSTPSRSPARRRGSTRPTSSATSAPPAPWAPTTRSGPRPSQRMSHDRCATVGDQLRGCATRGSWTPGVCGATGASRCSWRGRRPEQHHRGKGEQRPAGRGANCPGSGAGFRTAIRGARRPTRSRSGSRRRTQARAGTPFPRCGRSAAQRQRTQRGRGGELVPRAQQVHVDEERARREHRRQLVAPCAASGAGRGRRALRGRRRR